jgi:hypothetical protein
VRSDRRPQSTMLTVPTTYGRRGILS